MSTIAVDEQVLGFEIAVDDAPGVAEVDAVDELEHDKADLVLSDGGLVGGEEPFEILFGVLEDQMQVLLHGLVDHVLQTG